MIHHVVFVLWPDRAQILLWANDFCARNTGDSEGAVAPCAGFGAPPKLLLYTYAARNTGDSEGAIAPCAGFGAPPKISFYFRRKILVAGQQGKHLQLPY